MEIEPCRREFRGLRKSSELFFELDERSFCSHCSPGAKKQSLVLTVTYKDGTSHVSSDISHEDLSLLKAFMENAPLYSYRGNQYEVKGRFERLSEMLGLDVDAI